MPHIRQGSRPGPKVCLVTPGYLSSTPRVVREADALHAAGFDVRVVFAQGSLREVRSFDDELVANKPWRASAIRWSTKPGQERRLHFMSGIRRRAADGLERAGMRAAWIVDRAEGRILPELAMLAASEPADLYLGHYPTGLAAAYRASEIQGAMLGYDIEDLYADVYPPGADWEGSRTRILALEGRYVPRCAYLSAVSAPVAEVFADRYATKPPVLVHNCHAWADRSTMDGLSLDRRGPDLSLFWFSQTVGLDRGLQDAIVAAARVKHPVQLHFRGTAAEDVKQGLRALARSEGLDGDLHFHPRCAPHELLSRAAEHDVGLALETDASLSRRLSVTNKLFLYLTAGLAVAATDLPGQRGVLETVPDAGVLYTLGDVDALAAVFERWTRDRAGLAETKKAASEAARVRWNAENEAGVIVEAVSRLLHDAPVARARRA